jgi:hypothetical protein
MVLLDSSLITALFLISFARWANLSVDSVSPLLAYAPVIAAMIVVLLFPPSESRRRKVSLLSR